jgi:lysophospholipase L1-like esterase
MPYIKIMFLIFFGLALYILFLGFPIYLSINISEKIIANTIPFEQHPENPDRYILVAGDSTAVGVGALENTKSIAGRLGTQFPNADITNIGVSGARLKDLLLVLNSKNMKQYDLIVLQIGANDITHFTPYDVVKDEISEILLLASEHSSKTLLLTAGDIGRARVFHWPLSSIITSRTQNVRDIFLEVAAKYKNTSYVDLYLPKEDDPFEKDLKRYYSPDSFHLTGDGYGVWYFFLEKHL